MRGNDKECPSFMDIWLATCGEKDYIYKILMHYEEDISNCIKYESARQGIELSGDDFEDCRQDVFLHMIQAIMNFDIY